jgi:hypothetical protein
MVRGLLDFVGRSVALPNDLVATAIIWGNLQVSTMVGIAGQRAWLETGSEIIKQDSFGKGLCLTCAFPFLDRRRCYSTAGESGHS